MHDGTIPFAPWYLIGPKRKVRILRISDRELEQCADDFAAYGYTLGLLIPDGTETHTISTVSGPAAYTVRVYVVTFNLNEE